MNSSFEGGDYSCCLESSAALLYGFDNDKYQVNFNIRIFHKDPFSHSDPHQMISL